MKSITVILCTARREPKIEWAVDSILRELDCEMNLLIIDSRLREPGETKTWNDGDGGMLVVESHPVKPNVWQGAHRLTKDEWWAKSAALNTGLCLAKTEWVMCMDDRSVLLPGWLKAIRDAMKGNYAVAGSYEKRVNASFDRDHPANYGTVIGTDPRVQRGISKKPQTTYGDAWYGCLNALPLEWALKCGGYPEDVCDSLGYEDTVFGHVLARNNFIVKFDQRFKVIQDRTMPESQSLVKRTDFGESPRDKSHAIEDKLGGQKTSLNSFDIRAVRDAVQRGEPFPPPSASHYDWFDGAYIPTKFDALT